MNRLVPSMAVVLALASILAAAGVTGCSTGPSSTRLNADRKIYKAVAPYARKGGMGADLDLAWRSIHCQWAPTETACPGGPDDPELEHGFPPATGTAAPKVGMRSTICPGYDYFDGYQCVRRLAGGFAAGCLVYHASGAEIGR